MATFVVDANFFIQTYNYYYPLDVVPSFWEKVKQLAANGTIISITKVRTEITQQPDELNNWCSNYLPTSFFKDISGVLEHYAEIATWANSSDYKRTAIEEFLQADKADAWLVAFALNQNIPLVTYEVSAPHSKKRIKIPDVCIQFGVDCCTPIEMFRMLGESF